MRKVATPPAIVRARHHGCLSRWLAVDSGLAQLQAALVIDDLAQVDRHLVLRDGWVVELIKQRRPDDQRMAEPEPPG